VQRLFSTFADGWPGGGLFTQRLLLGAALFYSCVGCLSAKPVCGTLVPQSIGVIAGVLLLAGLWTPVAGVLTAIVEVWIAVSVPNSAVLPAILGALGASLAMIGPGAWSLDAWLFGRKHIEPPEL
jgi:putative oxidoreductase